MSRSVRNRIAADATRAQRRGLAWLAACITVIAAALIGTLP